MSPEQKLKAEFAILSALALSAGLVAAWLLFVAG